MTKNILFIIESSETGGAESVYFDLVQRVDREKYTPYVCLLYKGWLFDKFMASDTKPFLIPTRRGGFDFKLLWGVLTFVRQKNIDLIHSHLFTTNVYSSVVGALTDIPVISTFHGTMDIAYGDRFNWIKWQAINRFASKLVFVSRYLQEFFLKHNNVQLSKCVVVYNGIDVDKFKNKQNREMLRQQIGIVEDSFVIGCVGDLRPAKDYQCAIRAIALLKKKINNIKLIIAGTKTDILEELESLASSLGIIDDVIFLGFRNDIEAVLPAFDVYLSTSISEGFSLTVVEAMAARVPVVATRSGGPEEIVEHDVTGLLVEVSEPINTASAIDYLYRNSAVASSMTNNAAFQANERFSLQSMIDNYQKLYADLLI